jgi:DNA-binding SARP family transcriptional activator
MTDSAPMGASAGGPSVRVGLLGPFEVVVDGERIDLSQPQLRTLLAVLAMSTGRPVTVDRLADAAWGEDLPANARRTVQTYVTRLRSVLGAEAITTQASGYALCTSPDNVDALRFLRLVDRAAREPDVERRLLTEALRLWRDHPFTGIDSEWLHAQEGARLEERRLTALERRVDLDLAVGRHGSVVSELRELTAAYPLRESLWRRLLTALAQTGRPAEALEQYEVVRARIADELGVDPGVELQTLHADLLAGTVTAEDRPAPVLVPRQLPADIARFTGRDDLLARLDELLTPGTGQAAAVVAVHGPGGMGKTTLVVHWAHRVADAFPDGQLYLNLRGYGPGEPVSASGALETLLRGLGVEEQQLPTGSEAGENLLRSMLADRCLLVILDNARDADQVRPLLPGTGRSRVVVTSRSQLRGLVAREGAARVGLDQLDPAESVALLTAALRAHGSADAASTLTELAGLCGHLPLALAVAAERASGQPDLELGELVAELREEQERLDALDVGEESASLRAVFAWSYQALDPEVAAMFRLLGLHPGSDLSLPGAAALAGTTASRVRRLLDRLVDSNLVQQRRPGRYELHDLLHAYAAELSELNDSPSTREAASDRILSWYVHSVWHGAVALGEPRPVGDLDAPPADVVPLTFDGPREALAWLNGERSGIIDAVHRAAASGRHRIACHLTRTAWTYLIRRRALDELVPLLEAATASARAAGDLAQEAEVVHLLGRAEEEQEDHLSAIASFERAAELFGTLDQPVGQARALSNVGVVLNNLGRLDDSIASFERVIAIEERLGDPRELGSTVNNLAMTYIDMREYERALATASRAIELHQEAAEPIGEATALDTVGQALLGLDRPAEATDRLRRSRAMLRDLGARWEEGIVLTNLGRAHRDAGELDAARSSWGDALAILDELGAADGREFKRAEVTDLLASLPPQPSDQGHPSPGT